MTFPLDIDSRKMEALGQLSCGAAHDFNNILSVIMGYSELIESELTPDSPLRKYTQQIQEASRRAASLTRQLLVFSSKQVLQPTVLDLNDVVREMCQMLRRLIDESIEMKIVLGSELGNVKADSSCIGLLLVNLSINARDAMPLGGMLTIATTNAVLAGPGSYVKLTVSHRGAGMTNGGNADLFEKEDPGLGLQTCQRIVQQCNGYIEVGSSSGQGVTFSIYFPRVELPLGATVRSLRL